MVCLVNDEFIPIIPGDAAKLKKGILIKLHGSELGGYLGWQNLGVLVKKWFYWPSVNRDAR